MFAIMTGKFEAAKILVEAGARKDLKNDRGRTAMDLLEEMYLGFFFGDNQKGTVGGQFVDLDLVMYIDSFLKIVEVIVNMCELGGVNT